MSPGPLALIGGAEWQEGCSFDDRLLEAAQTEEIVVLPTAAAYEWPMRSVEAAERWFGSRNMNVRGLKVLQRHDAADAGNVEAVRGAKFIYLSDGSPLHLKSVLKGTALWEALVETWQDGAVVAGSSAGAMVLGDPMVDPRGGAFTLGLGLLPKVTVVPHWERWTGDKARRMTQLAPADVVLAEIEERTALIRWTDGSWEQEGAGAVILTVGSQPISLEELRTR